jgi:hypothetical protein
VWVPSDGGGVKGKKERSRDATVPAVDETADHAVDALAFVQMCCLLKPVFWRSPQGPPAR